MDVVDVDPAVIRKQLSALSLDAEVCFTGTNVLSWLFVRGHLRDLPKMSACAATSKEKNAKYKQLKSST
jgi:hypothetical protein